MRMFSILATSLGVALGSFAAEPMKVSVYPPGAKPYEGSTPNPAAAASLYTPASTPVSTPTSTPAPMPAASAPNVLDGTLVPIQTRMIDSSACCDTPSLRLRDRILPVAPTVSIPLSRDTSDCNACPSTSVPCGPRVTIDCGSNVCESPGRPGLFAGFFTKSACPSCDTASCRTEIASSGCFGCGFTCSGTILARIKGWLFFRPCDGPRIGLFRPVPYQPRSMTAFPMDCGHIASMNGTCQSGACSGSGLAARFTRGGSGCESGHCSTGTCSDGFRLGSRLGLGNCNGTKDCNNAEPKLSGTPFCAGYHFGSALPRTYGSEPIQIDPITGLVKTPKQKADKKDAVSNETNKIEQVSATIPVKSMGRSTPATKATTNSETKSNPLASPFSNP